MAKIKKAQLGDHLVKRKSQDDRIHRIEKKDPERAQRVADRVQKRALRSVKPSSVKPPSKMFIPLRERAKAANERKAAAAAKAPKAKLGAGIKKAQAGDKLKATRIINKGSNVSSVKQDYSVDTSGYAAGKKKFPATRESTMEKSGKKTQKNVNVRRSQVDRFIKNPSKTITQVRKYFKEGGDVRKAQKGDSLTYSTTGRYAPKQRVAIDTAGYAGGKKEFTATSDLMRKPRKVSRRVVDKTIGALKAGKIKKAQFGSTEGGRCGISRAAAKDARKSERDYAKQSRQAEREQKREVKAAAKQAKRTPSMRKGGNISKKK